LRLKIDNRTEYSTQDLRRFFLAGLTAGGAEGYRHVVVVYSRTQHHGRASIGGNCGQGSWITMYAPAMGKLDLLKFAQVFDHEVAHTMGVRHKDMAEDLLYCEHKPTWHEGLEIRHVAPAKPKVDRAAQREERARKNLVEWERRLKRAQTFVRKWRAKVRYYDRKRAAGKVDS